MFTHLSRRHFLQTCAAGIASTHSEITFSKSVPAIPRSMLGEVAASRGYFFGASAGSAIDSDAAYRELYVTQTRVITTDTALKIGTIAPRPGPKNFKPADRLLAFCNRHKIAMRGHCLIWNEWVPAWVKAMSKDERRTFFDSYIDEVVSHYAGRLHSWDVVNEPFWPGHHAPGGYRMGPWYDAFGTDYIRRAFVRAAQADNKTRLVLNEAQTERDDELGKTIRRGLLELVTDLKNAGVKLDVVGLQGHLQPKYPHDPAAYSEFLNALAGLGVDIYITEFDVRDDTFPDDIESRDRAVAQRTRQFLSSVFRHPAVKGVITWQLADNYSFYTDIAKKKDPLTERLPRPLPYDDRLQRKPMWYAIEQAFESAQHV